MSDKVVLAYSGGVDTSVAIRWLKEKYDLDVVTLTVDVGNEKDFIAVIKWKEIYQEAETVLDICEDVAHVVQSILLKQA